MIIKEIFSKCKDNLRTNCTFLEFQEFSRTKVIFKDFSRSVRTLLKITKGNNSAKNVGGVTVVNLSTSSGHALYLYQVL